MVKQIKCYEDESGKLHKCAVDAHRADLAIWLASSEAINAASAKQLVDWLTAFGSGRIDTLREALSQMSAAMPPAPARAIRLDDVA